MLAVEVQAQYNNQIERLGADRKADVLLVQDKLHIKGVVVDSETDYRVVGAHVYTDNQNRGTATDTEGRFNLIVDTSAEHLIVSHISYATKVIVLQSFIEGDDIMIKLDPNRSKFSQELVITSGRVQPVTSGVYSDVRTRPVEGHLGSIAGLDLVNRANFAREPVIRGQRGARIDVTIDGMRMTPACVDDMDPLTAYVETDNLKSIEIDRGHASQGVASNTSGGAINFEMATPSLNTGLTGNAEAGFHSVSNQQIYQGTVSHGAENWGIRISGTYRNAGDIQPGSGDRIQNSALEKGNMHASLQVHSSGSHTFGFQYLGDFAGQIGYPALIMDTRRADAHLAGLTHKWDRPLKNVPYVETRAYISSVQHRMDDFNRDVGQREVMKDMHMPMYGETVTWGMNTSGSYINGNHLIELRLESYLLEAFADMWMYPLDSNVSDMYLVNLGDVRSWNSSLSAGYTLYLEKGWRVGTDLRFESGLNRIMEQSAVATYKAEYPELADMEPAAFGYLVGMHIEKDISRRLNAGFRMSDGYRLPDHMERYGYYIYQPLDGYFYIGNPGLEPERSSQAEFYVTYGNGSSRLHGSTALWGNRMDRYITGERYDGLFKRYKNMGVAYLWGTETELTVTPHSNWEIQAGISYVFGYHNEVAEPLPMIPPLKGSVSVQHTAGRVDLEARMRWAANQQRIATVNSLEAPTAGYAIADGYVRIELTESIRLQAGIENILDRYYRDHLSVNALPAPGRNIHASLRFSF